MINMSLNWLLDLILAVVLLVCVHGFLQQSDPVVMKTLNTHGDRISDLEISVGRLLATNQDLQKAVTDLQTDNTALKAALQVNNQNCYCNTNFPAPSPTVRNTSTNTSTSSTTQKPHTKISTNAMVTKALSKPNNTNETFTQLVFSTMSAATASTNVKTKIQTTANARNTTKPTTTTKLLTTTKQTATTKTTKLTAMPTSTASILVTSQVATTKIHVPPLTTKLPTTSMSLNPVQCAVCTGPIFLCEQLYAIQTCAPPNNYCINKLINHNDGSREVSRTCGSVDTCLREWYQGSSDKDLCMDFDRNQFSHYQFECTFCCVSDSCNVDLKPKDNTLYVPVGR